jgi:hypothetical protein
MDNKILQICVANRFGVEIFEKHTCHCGFTVSNDGRHGLSCAKNKGRFSRHSDLIVIYCISVLDSILSTQEFLTASANARAFNILKWIKCD